MEKTNGRYYGRERVTANREIKDSIFCDLFSEKENALSLYNAINGTAYDDADELEIVTLKDVIYLHRKNDVSVMFDAKLTLWEHQSSANPNMPLRGLLYFARSIDGLLEGKHTLLYRKSLVKIPAPDYYVLYNGTDEMPERDELKLSDAFYREQSGYEWTAKLININAGHNAYLMDKCPALKGYAVLIGYVRENKANGLDNEEAVDKAVSQCIKEGFLEDYLLKKQGEARMMLLTEFDEKAWEEAVRSDGYDDGKKAGMEAGLKAGREEGREELLEQLVASGKLTKEEAEKIRKS